MRAKHYWIAGAFAYTVILFAIAIRINHPWAQYFAIPLFVIAYTAYFVFLDAGD